MTNTLHRYGKAESFADDYIVFSLPAKSKAAGQSGDALAAQFSSYKPFPDLAVNGKLTLGENIADVAGLAAAGRAGIAEDRHADGRDADLPSRLPRPRRPDAAQLHRAHHRRTVDLRRPGAPGGLRRTDPAGRFSCLR